MKALYTLKDGEIMARRANYMHASRDGGKTFTRYESAGAFERQTGHRVAPYIRSQIIKDNGGLSMKIGDKTKPVERTFQGVPFIIYFERRK